MATFPEPNAHPRLLLELVSEVDYRGLQLTRSYSVDSSADNTCVQTDVSFYLWQSIEEDLDSSYCDCYERENDDVTLAIVLNCNNSWSLFNDIRIVFMFMNCCVIS